GLLGDDAAHVLNATLFLALLTLLLAFGTRLFRSRWWATAGVALIVLFSGRTELYSWALTPVRDPATHLAALLGLFLLLPAGGARLSARRVAAAGLVLGYAGSIRPDAVLYLAPAGLVAAARWWEERPGWRPALRQLAAGAAALTLGLALLLVSCWSNPWAAARYLSGVHFLLPLLIVEGALGTAALVRGLRPAWAWWLATGFALALGAVTNLAGETPGTGTFAHLILLMPGLAAAGALAAAWSRRDVTM